MYDCLPMFQRVGSAAFKKDLTNTRLLCSYLGNPQEHFKTVHIAGTNGKGSTSHALAAILQCAGYKTGLYTSPHLKSFTERIRINGREISEPEVVAFVDQHIDAIKTISPSFFEMTVAMAFDHFANHRVDIAIIEVGLGGRLDSTNIILPEVSVITNIGYDHQAMLGDTLAQIAGEKAGIIKNRVPVVVSEYQEETAPVFAAKAKAEDTAIIYPKYNFKNIRFSLDKLQLDVYKGDKVFLSDLHTDLQGNYQLKNLQGILQTIEVLKKTGFNVGEESIRSGLGKVKTLTGLKGRWQVLGTEPLIVCDTGHNEAGIAEVVAKIATTTYTNLYIVFGMVNDKPPQKILRLLPKNAIYYFCQADIPRAIDANILALEAHEIGLQGEVEPDVNIALAKALEKAGKDDFVFVGGSNFVVAALNDL